MKKFTPYVLAYLIVATCTAIYPYIYRHVLGQTSTMPRHDTVSVVINPGMSRDELTLKLQQVGLSEVQAQHAPIIQPAPVLTTVVRLSYHYVFEAIVFSAFAGLVILFKRKCHSSVSGHDVAA